MKRADVILGLTVLFFCAAWLGGRMFLNRDGAFVVVCLDGEQVGSYALSEDREIDVGSGNHLSIRGGAVEMTSADCPDGICVRQGKISAKGAMITCLPNRVTVQIAGDKASDEAAPDAIAY